MIVHFALLIVLLLLNLIPEKYVNREKYILPLSFLVVLVYWSIRYDYGLDYWNYYDAFYSNQEENRAGFGERFFYFLFHRFKYYYQVIIAESVAIVVTFYHIVRKYISSKAYWLFFVLFFIVPGLHFNLISAQRSSMAACILYWGFDLFYINKTRWIPYIGFVFLAAMFHTSAIAFLALPIVHTFFFSVSGRTIFITLISSIILSLFIANYIYDYVVGRVALFNEYDVYMDRVHVRDWTSMFAGALTLFPSFFICENYRKGDKVFDRVCVLAFLFLILDFTLLNFQGRFTVYLYPFFITALCNVVVESDKRSRRIMLLPYFFILGYSLFWYYVTLFSLMNFEYSSGNMFFYHTIFDAPSLP